MIRLIETEGLARPVVVGHWLSGTQVALDVALRRPDLVRAAIVLSGVPKFVPTGSGMPEPKTPEMLAMMIDQYMAPQWFKIVTRETWDDDNFLPRDYAIHPLRGLQLWKEAARPTLPVWIRYLCEVWARDSTLDLDRLQVPLLIVKPVFDDLYHQGPQMSTDYMEAFLHQGWEGVEKNDLITIRSVKDSRVFIMDDQPEELDRIMARFLAEVSTMPAPSGSLPEEMSGRSGASTATSGRSSTPGPAYWKGGMRLDGVRHVLAGGAVSLELPDGSWEIRAVADNAPVVARIENPAEKGEIVLQIQPSFGATLDQVPRILEAQLRANYATYRVLSHGTTVLDGEDAVDFHCTYEDEGAEMRLRVVVASLGDDYLFSASLRAPVPQFAKLVGTFEGVGRSLALNGR